MSIGFMNKGRNRLLPKGSKLVNLDLFPKGSRSAKRVLFATNRGVSN